MKNLIKILVLVLIFASCKKEETVSSVKIHQFSGSVESSYENAYIVELDKSLVIVDATKINSTSKSLKEVIKSINKPVSAFLLTHGHPDHYTGLGNLIGDNKEIPIYSTQGVLDEIKRTDKIWEDFLGNMYKEEWPQNRAFPNKIVNDKQTLTFEGVKFTVNEVGSNESNADTYWIVDDGKEKHAIIGDLAYNHVHAFLADGHYENWVVNIDNLKVALKDVSKFYPGHGDVGTIEMFDWQKQYIFHYVTSVKELLGEKDKLSDEDKNELVKKMKEFLPSDILDWFIPYSADFIAEKVK